MRSCEYKAVLRLKLGPAELARVRFSDGISPIVEMALSTQIFRQRDALAFGPWQSLMRRELGSSAMALCDTVTSGERFPEFLFDITDELTDYLDRIDSLPDRQIAADVAHVVGTGAGTPFQARLAGGDRSARRELTDAITRYHRGFMRSWPALAEAVDADLSDRARLLATGGWSAVFGSLHNQLRWRSPYLELGPGPDEEWDLAGYELRLVPSTFLWRRPYVLVEGGPAAYLVYPRRGAVLGGPSDRWQRLADLVGPTRAMVLGMLRVPATTSELAARAGISLSSASEHAAVLRRAGLIRTRREGRAVSHRLTPLGRDALRGPS